QPRVFDGDRRLVCKALLNGKLFRAEGRKPVAVDDERADRLALAPQRRSRQRAGAGLPHIGQTRPIRYREIDIVDVGNVNLAVLGNDGARHVAATDLELGVRNARADALRTVAETDGFCPAVAFGDMNGGAWSAEQAG